MIENTLDNDEKIFGEKLDGIEYIDRIAVYGIAINYVVKIIYVLRRR